MATWGFDSAGDISPLSLPAVEFRLDVDGDHFCPSHCLRGPDRAKASSRAEPVVTGRAVGIRPPRVTCPRSVSTIRECDARARRRRSHWGRGLFCVSNGLRRRSPLATPQLMTHLFLLFLRGALGGFIGSSPWGVGVIRTGAGSNLASWQDFRGLLRQCLTRKVLHKNHRPIRVQFGYEWWAMLLDKLLHSAPGTEDGGRHGLAAKPLADQSEQARP